MGRRVLLSRPASATPGLAPRLAPRFALLAGVLAASALSACTPGTPGASEGGPSGENPHGSLTCATCHDGDQAELGEPAVPGYTCGASDCHSDGGPGEIVLSSVTFRHRGHADEADGVAMSCAGCHSHREGQDPISAGTDACSLCHADLLRGTSGSDCRFCHTQPTHEGMTAQGVAVPHEGLPWIQGECLRCHYDVSDPAHQVSAGACVTCHEDRSRITAAGIGRDLHPTHIGVGCTTCHTSGNHHIVAMSSAVVLECSQCHGRVHDVDVTAGFPGSATCTACHSDAHQAQQRLVLGVLPDLHALPSEKFLDGLTCRSCHVATPTHDGISEPLVGSAASCTGCHRPEYATILRWWQEGSAQRQRLSEAYLDRAEEALAGSQVPDTTRTLLASARRLLTATEEAGPEHNLPLAHRVYAEVVDRARNAFARAGRNAPPAPDLGTRPRKGICTYCHYRLDDAGRTQVLTPAQERFHREVLSVRELSGG